MHIPRRLFVLASGQWRSRLAQKALDTAVSHQSFIITDHGGQNTVRILYNTGDASLKLGKMGGRRPSINETNGKSKDYESGEMGKQEQGLHKGNNAIPRRTLSPISQRCKKNTSRRIRRRRTSQAPPMQSLHSFSVVSRKLDICCSGARGQSVGNNTDSRINISLDEQAGFSDSLPSTYLGNHTMRILCSMALRTLTSPYSNLTNCGSNKSKCKSRGLCYLDGGVHALKDHA